MDTLAPWARVVHHIKCKVDTTDLVAMWFVAGLFTSCMHQRGVHSFLGCIYKAFDFDIGWLVPEQGFKRGGELNNFMNLQKRGLHYPLCAVCL